MITPHTAGALLPWFSKTLRQIINPPPEACAQLPAGTAPGQTCGAGVGDDGTAWVGSRWAATKALLIVSTTIPSQGNMLPGHVHAGEQFAHAGTAAVCAPSRAA